MRPFYFGRAGRQLYGVYEAATGRDLRRGAVVCNAAGSEYYLAHQACRSLAQRISARGVHALRFDYLGTGDSSGEVKDFAVADWTSGVAAAVDELKDMTGLSRVHLVGLRAGAGLAAEASTRRSDVMGLVLWDPLASADEGAAALHPREFSASFGAELNGLPWPRPGEHAVDTLLVTHESHAMAQRSARAEATTSGYATMVYSGPRAWVDSSGDLGRGGLPVDALEAIADWIGRA